MLWHNLKEAVHAWKSYNVAELKQFFKEQQPRFLHSDVRYSLPVHANAWLLPRVAQSVIRFKGNYFFTETQVDLDNFFPLINKIILFGVIFVQYWHFFHVLKDIHMTNKEKMKKSKRWEILFHSTVLKKSNTFKAVLTKLSFQRWLINHIYLNLIQRINQLTSSVSFFL